LRRGKDTIVGSLINRYRCLVKRPRWFQQKIRDDKLRLLLAS
jgi:hypothetical protein